jgi:uncharacterized protein
MTLDAQLYDQEIDELDIFLESEARPHKCMSYNRARRLSHRVAIGPGVPLPSRWMPVIWGGQSDPVVESTEEAHRIVGLIMRRMNMVGAMLGKTPPAFEPILYEGELEGGGTIVVAHDWCAGFLAGVELAYDDWQPLLSNQTDSAFLVPFVKLGTDEGRDEINAAEDPRAEYDKFVDLLTPCVVALDGYWKQRSRESSVARREAFDRPRWLRPGRNDACPCGSGSKFKKCCYGT